MQEARGREDDHGEAGSGSMEVGEYFTGESYRKGEAFFPFSNKMRKLFSFRCGSFRERERGKGSKRVAANILYYIVPQY